MSSQQQQYLKNNMIIGGHYEDEGVLLRGLQNLNPSAQTAFYMRNLNLVERITARTLGFSDECSDVVQDIFLKAFRNIHQFKGEPCQLKRWLLKIAINTLRIKLRTKKRWSWIRLANTDETFDPNGNFADAETICKLKRAYRILNNMKAEDKIIFLLRVVDNMTMEEIAGVSGISLSSAKRKYKAAKERFIKRAQNDPLLIDYVEGS